MLNLFLLGKKVTKNNPTSTRSLDQDKNTQKIKNQKTIHQSAQKQKGAALSYPFSSGQYAISSEKAIYSPQNACGLAM